MKKATRDNYRGQTKETDYTVCIYMTSQSYPATWHRVRLDRTADQNKNLGDIVRHFPTVTWVRAYGAHSRELKKSFKRKDGEWFQTL